MLGRHTRGALGLTQNAQALGFDIDGRIFTSIKQRAALGAAPGADTEFKLLWFMVARRAQLAARQAAREWLKPFGSLSFMKASMVLAWV